MPRNRSKPLHRLRPHHAKPRNSRRSGEPDRVLLYGLHAVEAALANPKRVIGRLLATENAARRLDRALRARSIDAEAAIPRQLVLIVGAYALHPGVVRETTPLPPVDF